MIKSIAFIVLTHFFHFNEIKILRQPAFFEVKPTIFFSQFTSHINFSTEFLSYSVISDTYLHNFPKIFYTIPFIVIGIKQGLKQST